MFGTIRNIFHREKALTQRGSGEGACQLSIDGIPPAPLTPEPDEAELAAEAWLESEAESRKHGSTEQWKSENPSVRKSESPVRDANYYQTLAVKMKSAHEQEARAAMRYVAYCEAQLAKIQDSRLRIQEKSSDISHQTSAEPGSQSSDLRPQSSDLAKLEAGLFKHQDVVERSGGELKRRWQKCLATVTVRQMAEAARG